MRTKTNTRLLCHSCNPLICTNFIARICLEIKDNMAKLSDIVSKIIEAAHPVGSYYLTETDTNPSAILHVGTWVQLKDRMLIGCGDSFAISSEGGEKEHTLSIAEMPNHNHNTYGQVPRINDELTQDLFCHNHANGSWAFTTCVNSVQPTGGSMPHNNMPPYHSCFIWRRTA